MSKNSNQARKALLQQMQETAPDWAAIIMEQDKNAAALLEPRSAAKSPVSDAPAGRSIALLLRSKQISKGAEQRRHMAGAPFMEGTIKPFTERLSNQRSNQEAIIDRED